MTLLDIGTGAGDLPPVAVRWGARRGMRVVPLALERSPVGARLARGAGLPVAVADGLVPPVRPASVDVVLLAMVLHHFAEEAAIALLRSAASLARVGVIVCDLERSRLAQALFPLGGWLLGLHRVTVDDGVTSLARGYTAGELAALCARAGLRGAAVARRPGWRVVATWATAHP